MYDPARDIFTETQPSSAQTPESYDLSALDTLAGLAAEAESASFPPETKNLKEIAKNDTSEIVRENGKVEDVQGVVPGGNDDGEVVGGGGAGVAVARTKEPEMTLKVTLHLTKGNRSKREEMQTDKNGKAKEESSAEPDLKREDEKTESLGSPMKMESQIVGEPKEETKEDGAHHDESRNDKGEHSYPI